MIKIVKGNNVINATKKAYKVVYKDLGYRKYDNDKKLKDLTVPELRELAKEKGLTGYSDMKKDELIEKLGG